MNNPLDKLLSGDVEDKRYQFDSGPEELATIGEVMRGEQHPRSLTEPIVEGPRLPISGGEVVFPIGGDAPYYVGAASVEEL